MPVSPPDRPRAIVIGGGPAGLMAAEVMADGGVGVDVYDSMPSVGRKFLLAGIGGLNITHSESFDAFCGRFGEQEPVVRQWLSAFDADHLRAWAQALGIDTFIGSSGRVFPAGMKAAPLLRAWLHRLREAGVRIHCRHRFLGWGDGQNLRFQTPEGETSVLPRGPVVLALGGGSWPRLGSDGHWVPWLEARGVGIAPLRPANCGFDVEWSEAFRDRFAGAPLKSVRARCREKSTPMRARSGDLAHAWRAEARLPNLRAPLDLDLPERKILRRAISHGRQLGQDSPFLHKMVFAVRDSVRDAYRELGDSADRVESENAHEDAALDRPDAVEHAADQFGLFAEGEAEGLHAHQPPGRREHVSQVGEHRPEAARELGQETFRTRHPE